METLDDHDVDTTGTVFRDVILLALIGFVAMVIMLLPHLNPKAKEPLVSPPFSKSDLMIKDFYDLLGETIKTLEGV